jgi:hypothetical protein
VPVHGGFDFPQSLVFPHRRLKLGVELGFTEAVRALASSVFCPDIICNIKTSATILILLLVYCFVLSIPFSKGNLWVYTL